MADEPRLTKRQLKKLVKEQTAIVKKDANNLVARLKLAGALKDLGKNKDAVEHYQAVAKAYAETGKLVQAISVYKGILEIAPGDESTESALTELSSRRAEEIKRKSMPRLQQVDGRWVMPTEDEVSEEEGTDPGKAPTPTPSATPSVLRLPAPPSEPGLSPRRVRRSRPKVSRPTPEPGSQAARPPSQPVLPGAPDVAMSPQASLPSLFEGGQPSAVPSPLAPAPAPLQPVAPPSSPSPPADTRAAVPPPVPPVPTGSPATPAPTSPATVPPGVPAEQDKSGETQRSVPDVRDAAAAEAKRAAALAGESELELTVEEPEHYEGEDDFAEPTSPGPASYKETIRKSMPRLDVSKIMADRPPRAGGPPRRTLVGVPLPDHPDLTGAPAEEAHTRPTPSAPVPALPREAAPSEEEVTATREADADEDGRTRPLKKVATADESSAEPTSQEPAEAAAEPALLSDETLGSVFDDEEEAFWAEFSGEGLGQEEQKEQESAESDEDEPSTQEVPAAEPAKPTRQIQPVSKPAAGQPPRVSKATMPMPSVSPPPSLAPKPTPAPAAKAAGTDKKDGSRSAPAKTAATGKPATAVQLEEIRLFRDLSESSRELLKSRMVVRKEKPGAVIVKEGDPGNALFVVSSGKVEVLKKGRQGAVRLATLGPGAFFGEFALLSDRRRHATVRVTEDGVFFEISRKIIADLTKAEPAFGNTLRAFYRRRLLDTLVHSAPFFEPLGLKERESLMGRLRFRRIPEKSKIITQGEPGGGFFLILIGTVQVTKKGDDGKEQVLAKLGDGTYFGEMSLLKGGNAVASVSTVTPVELVQLAASEFYRVLSNYPQIWEEVNREAKRRELANLQILSGRSTHVKRGEGVVM